MVASQTTEVRHISSGPYPRRLHSEIIGVQRCARREKSRPLDPASLSTGVGGAQRLRLPEEKCDLQSVQSYRTNTVRTDDDQ